MTMMKWNTRHGIPGQSYMHNIEIVTPTVRQAEDLQHDATVDNKCI